MTRGKSDAQLIPAVYMPTEQEINEWTRRSIKEGMCGIVNCFNIPTTECKKCKNHYCSDHFPFHLDLLPEGETEHSNSSDGLERFMNDESEHFNSDEDWQTPQFTPGNLAGPDE
ncbi:MAG: hypothetical protein WBX01_04560 [Nitrososphaeraceae archaeon]